MKLRLLLTVTIVLAMALPAAPAAAAADAANWQSDLLAWRVKRTENLTAPDGWLSLVALDWLDDGDSSFGSAADNRIPIPGSIPAHLGIVHLQKDTVHLLPPPGGFPKELQIDGHPAQEQDIISDEDPKPSKLTVGSLTIILIHRDERFGLRIKDPQAPTRAGFHGLHWYEPNATYRVHATWTPYNPPKSLDIPTVLGTVTHMPAPGVAEFKLAGRSFRLEPVLEDPGDKELFFILRDTTSKKTTYGAGRFLYAEFPDHGLSQPGKIWIDFNRLYNPPCAFSAFATCPLPPTQNRLPIPIPAGEKRYHD